MISNPLHSELSRQMIQSGTWVIDTERGHVISRRLGRPIGHHREYVELCVVDHKTDKRYQLMAHRVIWEHAHGPIEDLTLQINHKNGVKSDNRAANLELGTALHNTRHAFETGLIPPQRLGPHSPKALLSEAQATQIRTLLRIGALSQDAIAERFGVSQATISLIKSGRRYGDAAQERIMNGEHADEIARHPDGERWRP